MQVCEPFNETAALSIGPIAVSFVVLVLLMLTGHFIRKKWVERDSSLDEAEEHWLHQCHHSEDEFFSFGMGFQISLTIRFYIMLSPPAVHAVPKGRDQYEVQ